MQRHMPLGYRIADGRAEIVPEAARIVRAVFQEYLNGVSTYRIARELTEQGILNASHKPSWNHGSVGKILENVKYRGDDFYPPLIDRERFEQVQMRRREKAESLGRNAQLNSFANESTFSRKLYCGNCGEQYRRYVEHSGQTGEIVKWKCRHYIWKNRVCCRNRFLTDAQIETAFIEIINPVIANPALLGRHPQVQSAASSPVYEKLSHQIEQMLETGGCTADEIKRLVFERAAEKYRVSKADDWQYQTGKLEAVLCGKEEQTVFDRELFTTAIKKVVIYEDGRLQFEFINGLVQTNSITEKKKEAHT